MAPKIRLLVLAILTSLLTISVQGVPSSLVSQSYANITRDILKLIGIFAEDKSISAWVSTYCLL
jgi:hypothetical protein